jgi:hypothetical protein
MAEKLFRLRFSNTALGTMGIVNADEREHSDRTSTPQRLSGLSLWASMQAQGLKAAGAGRGPTGALRTRRRWMHGLPNPIDDGAFGKLLVERMHRTKGM